MQKLQDLPVQVPTRDKYILNYTSNLKEKVSS